MSQIERLIRVFDLLNCCSTEATAMQSFTIDTMRFSGFSRHHEKWRYIFRYNCSHRAECVHPDAAELVHHGKSTQDGIIIDADMAAQGGAVGHDDMVPYQAIMGHMYISHEKIVIADTRDTAALDGSAIDGGKFADDISITYFETGRLSGIFHVLWIISKRRELGYPVISANNRRTFNHNM